MALLKAGIKLLLIRQIQWHVFVNDVLMEF